MSSVDAASPEAGAGPSSDLAQPRAGDPVVACVSLPKTGSMALTSALRGAGFDAIGPVHHLGDISSLSPSVALLSRGSEHSAALQKLLADPERAFRIVTCVRDPIACIVSMYFQFASSTARRTGVEPQLTADAIVAWRQRFLSVGFFDRWFDLVGAALDVDFRRSAFDHNRRSLRFESPRLKWLVLRQDEPQERREEEIGWLLDRERVALASVNETKSKPVGAAYDNVVSTFVAPERWLEELYDGEVARHFFLPEEREHFRRQWSGDGVVTPLATPQTAVDAPPAPAPTVACLSMAKTHSTALTAALQEAGFPAAHHIHYLGPISIGRVRRRPVQGPLDAEMREIAEDCVTKLADPTHPFVLVSCVRDPIARLVAQYFESHKNQLGDDLHKAVTDWVDGIADTDWQSVWFDDNFKATFGVDFRGHPFDRDRKSIRVESGRLKLVVLRQEDPLEAKEAELGWLLGRDRVALPRRNDSRKKRYFERYEAFLASFVAPASWFERYYTTDVARHFYTDAELDAFRAKWSAGLHREPSPAAEPQPQPEPRPEPKPAALAAHPQQTSVACLSLAKTSSTALTAALRSAGYQDATHLHYMGPKSRARFHGAVRAGTPAGDMLDAAEAFAARLGDPTHAYRLVTCVRDPIGRLVAQYFENTKPPPDLPDPCQAVIDWVHTTFRQDVCTAWFDDNYGSTFGFDFREHPFDHDRKSIRFESDRLRLVIFRQEDPQESKEAELGWLLDHDQVSMRRRNETRAKPYAEHYARCLNDLVVPDHWLDMFYETDFARHFYTDQERATFRSRWCRRDA